MCFSANASFGGSVAIGTIAVITLLQVKKLSQVPFAAIPLFFAVQQFTEGILWVALSDPVHDSWQHYPIYVFLIFAQLIWPFWIPFSIFFLEKNPIRRRWLFLVLLIGLMVSSYLLYCMLVFEVSAEIRSGHIQYTLDFPLEGALTVSLFYGTAVVAPLFLSSDNGLFPLGLLTIMSFMGTIFFFQDYVISVWCFFAAVLGIMVLGIMLRINKEAIPLATSHL